MSIVGPRPIVKDEKKKYGENLKKVLSIKPGITGLWQVSGRNNLTYKRRVMLDLNYVKNYNLLMDIRILIRTFGVILFPLDRGAY
jgi:lipopolysaccharide/colanic/teichoic acid biosynthesis glycosyltransferase